MEAKVKKEAGKIIMLKVNVDKCPELAAELGVSSIPHVFLRYKGKFVDSNISSFYTIDFVGHPKDTEVDAFIEKAVKLKST